uniref:PH domain-containing protein n=1 Tax=Apteryx owenii TaxID=8824 RepID=A0A8B9QNB6_APTOW
SVGGCMTHLWGAWYICDAHDTSVGRMHIHGAPEESSFWLPLYGSMCCRLAAQPRCMAAQMMCGFLRLQQAGEPQSWARLYCVLRGTNLFCYRRPQEAEAKVEPALTIAINKVGDGDGDGEGDGVETRIRAAEKDAHSKLHSMSVTNRYGGEEVTHTLLAESRADMQRWMEAFWQHFYDMSQWKQCCDELMKIEVPSPRRPPALLPKQGSLYHEMGESPNGIGCEAFLLCPGCGVHSGCGPPPGQGDILAAGHVPAAGHVLAKGTSRPQGTSWSWGCPGCRAHPGCRARPGRGNDPAAGHVLAMGTSQLQGTS